MNKFMSAPEASRTDEAEALYRCVETADQKEGVAAFIEKRTSIFKNR